MISLVQAVSQNYGGGFSLAFGSNNTAGNMLVMVSNQNSTTFTIMDTAGNQWVLLTSLTGSPSNNSNGAIYVCYSCVGGANTVTIGGSGLSVAAFTIAEFSGVNALDTGASMLAPGTSGSTWTSNAITTAYANELLLGFVNNQLNPLVTVNSPFSVLGTNEGYFLAFYQIVSSVQTGVTASGNITAGQPPTFWAYGLFGFYEASGSVIFDNMDF